MKKKDIKDKNIKKKMTMDSFVEILEENNIACIFSIPDEGCGTFAKSKTDLLVLTDIARSKMHFLEMQSKNEAKLMFDKSLEDQGLDLNESKKIKNYVG